MNELVNFGWFILVAILCMGLWFFAVVAADVVIDHFKSWLKPEWLESNCELNK